MQWCQAFVYKLECDLLVLEEDMQDWGRNLMSARTDNIVCSDDII